MQKIKWFQFGTQTRLITHKTSKQIIYTERDDVLQNLIMVDWKQSSMSVKISSYNTKNRESIQSNLIHQQ